MAKKSKPKSNNHNKDITLSLGQFVGIVVVLFIAAGAYLYTTQQAVPTPSAGTTPVATPVATPATTSTPTPTATSTPPPTPTATKTAPPTPIPTPIVTEATPPPTTTASSTPTVSATPIATGTSTGTTVYQSVDWSLNTGSTSTAAITFGISGTWSGTIKAQVKKDVFGTDTVIGETDQYVSGKDTTVEVTVSFPARGQIANAGDMVFIRVEGIYDIGGLLGIIGGTTERKAAGTEVQMPSIGTVSPSATPQAQFNVVNILWSTSSGDPNPSSVLSVPVGTKVYFYATIEPSSAGDVNPNIIGVVIKKDIMWWDDKALNPLTGQWDGISAATSYDYELGHAFRGTGNTFYLSGTKVVEIGSFIVDEATTGTLREYFAKGYVYYPTGISAYNSYNPTDPGTRNRVTTS